MANSVLLKRSSTEDKRPVAANMLNGELDLNYSDISGGIFYKNASGSVVKVGPAQVGATAPNSTPAGSSGNSVGEFWYDTTASALKIYNGTAWVAATGATPPAGANTQIQFNSSGVFGADADFTFDSTTNTLSVPKVNAARISGVSTNPPNVPGVLIQPENATTTIGYDVVLNGGLTTNSSGPLSKGGDVYLNGGESTDAFGGDEGGGVYILAGRGKVTPGPIYIDGGSYESTSVAGAGGLVQISGGNSNNYDGGEVTVRGGGGNNPNSRGGNLNLLGGTGPINVGGTGVSGDVILKGGDGFFQGNPTSPGGNVTISGGTGTATGYVSISDITVASTKATYVPTAGTDLATKSYVDSRPGSSPAGSNTQIQFNNNGAFGADADFTYNSSSNTLSVGNISGLSSNFALTVPNQATTNIDGYNVSFTAGLANGTGTGGAINLTSGAGEVGGNINIVAATSTLDGGETGTVYIKGGTPNTANTQPSGVNIQGSSFVNLPSGEGGPVLISGGSIAGTGGRGGNITLIGGSAAAAGALNLEGGTSIVNGGTAGNVNINGGLFAAGVSTSGTAGNVNITGGTGPGAGVDNVNGGNVTIAGGAAIGTGTSGNVQISDITVASAKATYTPTAATDLTTKAYVDLQKTNPGGTNGQVQFNNNGVFGGDPELTYNPTTNVLTIPNILSGNTTLDLVAGAQLTPGETGHNVSVIAGAANGNSNGGNVILTAGTSGGLAASGGQVTITGGNATGTNNTAGGNVVISGGSGIGTGADGSVYINDIVLANAKASYVPTNSGDLTTKEYVDQISVGGLRQFGSFLYTGTQTQSATADAVNVLPISSTVANNGVTTANTTQVVIPQAGKYSFTFSLQMTTATPTTSIYVWVRKNGVDVANSGNQWLLANNDYIVGTVNYVDSYAANDYIEIVWWANHSTAQVVSVAAQAAVAGVSPAIPGVPGGIITVVPV